MEGAVPRWNVIQALLRKSSGCIQSCMLVLLATVLFTLMLAGFDLYQMQTQGRVLDGANAGVCISSLIPALVLLVGISRVFFKASVVSDKCLRVPSLINACCFSSDPSGIDRE